MYVLPSSPPPPPLPSTSRNSISDTFQAVYFHFRPIQLFARASSCNPQLYLPSLRTPTAVRLLRDYSHTWYRFYAPDAHRPSRVNTSALSAPPADRYAAPPILREYSAYSSACNPATDTTLPQRLHCLHPSPQTKTTRHCNNQTPLARPTGEEASSTTATRSSNRRHPLPRLRVAADLPSLELTSRRCATCHLWTLETVLQIDPPSTTALFPAGFLLEKRLHPHASNNTVHAYAFRQTFLPLAQETKNAFSMRARTVALCNSISVPSARPRATCTTMPASSLSTVTPLQRATVRSL